MEMALKCLSNEELDFLSEGLWLLLKFVNPSKRSKKKKYGIFKLNIQFLINCLFFQSLCSKHMLAS